MHWLVILNVVVFFNWAVLGRVCTVYITRHRLNGPCMGETPKYCTTVIVLFSHPARLVTDAVLPLADAMGFHSFVALNSTSFWRRLCFALHTKNSLPKPNIR